jgi:hypothetical protein
VAGVVRVAVAVAGGCPIRSLERIPRDGRVVLIMLVPVWLGKTGCLEMVANDRSVSELIVTMGGTDRIKRGFCGSSYIGIQMDVTAWRRQPLP